jgi:hypothetical protein
VSFLLLLMMISDYRGLVLAGCGVLLLAAGSLLFRISRKLDDAGGRMAVLDLATSAFGVCVLFLILCAFFPHLRPAWFVACAVIGGVFSSALFRFGLKG